MLGALLFVAFLPTFLGERAASADSSRPVAVEVVPSAPELDPAALRDAVARELDSPVVQTGDARAAFTLVVSIDRARGELVVERRDEVGGISRRVPLPADPREALEVAVFLIGNLARDEAADLVRSLRPPPSPVAPSAPTTAAAEPAETPRASWWQHDPWPARPGAPSRPPRFWIGVSVEGDLLSVPSAAQVCAAGSGFACTDGNGADYLQSSVEGGRVTGGEAYAGTRVLSSFEYAATPNLLVGGRLGTVFGGYPGHNVSTVPAWAHVETRLTYVFGDDPFASMGALPYVMVAAGISTWSAGVDVATTDGSGAHGHATAWTVGGLWFASAGSGVRFAVSPSVAVLAGPRLTTSFGADGARFAFGWELGIAYGFR